MNTNYKILYKKPTLYEETLNSENNTESRTENSLNPIIFDNSESNNSKSNNSNFNYSYNILDNFIEYYKKNKDNEIKISKILEKYILENKLDKEKEKILINELLKVYGTEDNNLIMENSIENSPNDYKSEENDDYNKKQLNNDKQINYSSYLSLSQINSRLLNFDLNEWLLVGVIIIILLIIFSVTIKKLF